MNNAVTVQTDVSSTLDNVWKSWTGPEHIVHWNAATVDWECPSVENDLLEGGKFKYVMRAKDKSASFDFEGTYTKVEEGRIIEYVMPDGRRVSVLFEEIDGKNVRVTEIFDPEDENPVEMQKAGWQSILDHFKKYTESIGK